MGKLGLSAGATQEHTVWGQAQVRGFGDSEVCLCPFINNNSLIRGAGGSEKYFWLVIADAAVRVFF